MSWHYLQAQAAESWEGSCLDGAPDALLSLIPTQDGYSSQDRKTDACHGSLSGTMSAPSTASPGADTSTLLAVGFHARTSAVQAKVQASTASGLAYGENLLESFARYDPDTCSWRTRQCSLLGGFTVYSETWPRWGLMRGGECWELGTLEPSTEGIGSGYSLPTPTKNDSKGAGSRRFLGSDHYRGAKTSEALRRSREDPIYLDPCFGEWLMRWPIKWTDCEPLETGKFQRWLRLHGRF